MNEIPTVNPENEPKYNNVAVRFLVGNHFLDTESRYAEYRKSVEDTGLSFFRRGFTNILYLEYARQNLEEKAEDALKDFNEYALSKRSFRRAYWRLAGADEQGIEKMIRKLDHQPIQIFSALNNDARISEGQAKSASCTYATYVALDGILRKGIDVVVHEEEFTDNRAELARFTQGYGYIPDYMRKLAASSERADVDFAKQINGILDRNPYRTRILCVLGAVHSRVAWYLPEEIGEVQITKFIDEPNGPEVEIVHDLQDGTELSDDEIMERIKAKSK